MLQFAVVVPEENLAAAITSCLDNMQDVLTILWDGLIPFLEDDPLPENPAGHQELLELLSNLSMPVAEGTARESVPNQTFEFSPNSAGIHSCSVEIGGNECALTFSTARGMEQLRAGFVSHRVSVFQLTDTMPHPTAASAAWVDGDVLEVRTFCLDGTYRDTYRIDPRNREHPVTRTSRCSILRPLMPALTRVASC